MPSLRTALRIVAQWITLPTPKNHVKESKQQVRQSPDHSTKSGTQGEIAALIIFEKKKLMRNDGVEREISVYNAVIANGASYCCAVNNPSNA